MDWRLMEDANRENKNAGNGGDLVKHTVYLATIQFLTRRKPWSEGLFVRECHAGRGMYPIPDEPRRRRLSRLYSDPVEQGRVLLQSTQQRILRALGCWPEASQPIKWYAGSAAINADMLNCLPGPARLDLYECIPETRQILRSVMTEMRAHVSINVLPSENHGAEFDGEAHIARAVGGWGKQDLIMLDPFAMWRQIEDQAKRDLYSAIVDGLIGRLPDAPSLILFWTWGRSFPVADGDVNGTGKPVKNGYADLRTRLHASGLRIVVVKWRWDLQFAVWVVVPAAHAEALGEDVASHCVLLTDHLTRNRYHLKMHAPQVEID